MDINTQQALDRTIALRRCAWEWERPDPMGPHSHEIPTGIGIRCTGIGIKIFLYECYTKTVINPRTYDETICIMFKLFLYVVKVAFNLFLEVAYINCIKRIYII